MMTTMSTTEPQSRPKPPPGMASRPPTRIGTAVVQELVQLIVTGEFKPGDLLPPEGPLADRFGVSRTVIRESVKRLQEKGLVVVGQGRGTQVLNQDSWRMLDEQVLSALVDDDSSNDILSELSAVRASLEALMAGAAAAHHTAEQLAELGSKLSRMPELREDEDDFYDADQAFHLYLMEISGNRLAHNITKALYSRALQSPRFRGHNPHDAMQRTLDELQTVYDAITNGDVQAAERAMRDHIDVGWQRRRLADCSERACRAPHDDSQS